MNQGLFKAGCDCRWQWGELWGVSYGGQWAWEWERATKVPEMGSTICKLKTVVQFARCKLYFKVVTL